MSGYHVIVAGSGQPPLLFLDVDGPLIPFGAPPEQYQIFWTDLELGAAGSNPSLVRLNPDHGSRLAPLPCELVWATGWADKANECIAPLLGLPVLPVVVWPEPAGVDEQGERNGLLWKTRAVLSWAAGRPFAWLDDEVTATDQAWVSTHHPSDALLHRVDPRVGLTDTDYVIITEWLRKVGRMPGSPGTS